MRLDTGKPLAELTIVSLLYIISTTSMVTGKECQWAQPHNSCLYECQSRHDEHYCECHLSAIINMSYYDWRVTHYPSVRTNG